MYYVGCYSKLLNIIKIKNLRDCQDQIKIIQGSHVGLADLLYLDPYGFFDDRFEICS